jgi:uncharacterized protein (DUF433 family)
MEVGQMLDAKIIDRGRGPEIARTRITVYDVLDYHKSGMHRDVIAGILDLSSERVEVAVYYIKEHRDEVMADYAEMLARDARGNPPDLQAKSDAARERLQTRLRELREAKSRHERDADATELRVVTVPMGLRETKSREAEDAGDSGGH